MWQKFYNMPQETAWQMSTQQVVEELTKIMLEKLVEVEEEEIDIPKLSGFDAKLEDRLSPTTRNSLL